MNYSKANINNLEEIYSLYQNAIIAMEKDNIHQWDEIYPDKDILKEDITKNKMYIGKTDNKIAVCFVLSEECDEEYKNGCWKYPDSRFNVIHRLCVNPLFQNQGIAAKTLEYIENLSKSEGYDSIRLDCFTQNPYSIKLYDKAGYSITGYADWRKGRFELREKKL
ncbi:Acetyltransferase (GNAT) family protein [Treponema bryantii]|uniref:Acetyltransferase (GNAT) family protein n=1 Tax=Treponema bryantii TaxID=163 RepID=A0A1I3HYB4_9SPIR|nr:GNAT family N-acetyltransferase [Treponema bryantii]SFI40579.1 Acetyltransferase (GNAT) family protein [Treponema bryantii]